MSSIIRGSDGFDSGAPFAKKFNGYSLRQAYTSTASQLFTFAHGLGVAPMWAEIYFENTVTDGGWSPGDILKMSYMEGTGNYGGAIWADATNIYIRCGSLGFQLPNKSTGSGFVAAINKWNVFPVAMY